MRVLFLAPVRNVSGNLSTASRITDFLTTDSHCVFLKDPSHFDASELTVVKFCADNSIDCILALHAFKSGQVLVNHRGSLPPIVLIFGGTDLYQDIKDDTRLDVMYKIVHSARILVCFSETMLNQCLKIWPDLNPSQICVIPQSVSSEQPSTSYDVRAAVSLGASAQICLLVAGIRAVKDPAFLLPLFGSDETQLKSLHFVVVGPILDEDYAAGFKQRIKNLPRVHYVGALSNANCLSAIQSADIVVNTSLSEATSQALLEAMHLGTPVAARDIEGNRAIITSGSDHKRGLLFSNIPEAAEAISDLLNNTTLRENISNRAAVYVRDFHSSEREHELYTKLLHQIFDRFYSDNSL